MLRASQLIPLLLLALWFSATQHCDLAGSGLIAPCHERATAGECQDDGCDQVERGTYRWSVEISRAPAPVLLVADPFLGPTFLLSAPEPAVAVVTPSFTRPLNWVTTWHFVQRAAPPSRAPTLFLA